MNHALCHGDFLTPGIQLQSFLLQAPPASLVCSSSPKSHIDPSSHLGIFLIIQILTSALDQSLGNYCVHSLCNLAVSLPLPSPRNKYSKLQLLLHGGALLKRKIYSGTTSPCGFKDMVPNQTVFFVQILFHYKDVILLVAKSIL